jgi:serine/threonine-protein kinase
MATLRTIGKYEIVDALGTGGMGTVYRAFDPALERLVAVKLLHLDRVHEVSQEELSARFRNEARAVARFNHPAIVAIFDYDDQDPAGAYIAMEYVNGCALDEYVKKRPELHLEDAVSAMLQVLAGLAYAHRQGVVHRDIKPSNLLVTRDGLVKITDFGIAKIGPRSQTQTGLMVGTPQYMAPEQYMGGQIDHRVDVHAAGAVLYELLTGKPPFNGGAAEIMYKICYEAPPALSTANPAIPKAFDAVVAKALEKTPANRYQSAGEFHEALRGVWQSTAPDNKPASQTLSERARMIATVFRREPMGQEKPPATPSRPQQSGSASPLPASASVPSAARPVPIAQQGAGPLLETRPPPVPSVGFREAARGETAAVERTAPPALPIATVTAARAATASPVLTTASPALTTATPHLSRTDPARAASLAAWSQDQLKEVERQLTPIVGPVARAMVRDAAANTGTRQQLYELLASRLRSPEEKHRFLESEIGASGTGRKALSLSAGNVAAVSGIQAGRPLTPEVQQRASQLLARYLGPIAATVTNKAARNAVDEAHLYSLLAQKLPDPIEQQRFLDDAGRSR